MGAPRRMSTPSCVDRLVIQQRRRGFGHPFSGKLSPVTTMFDKQKQIEPEEQPTEVEQNAPASAPRELGGREGPEPTRFGDWELRGRCIDF
jgi:hypothetical protein